MSHFSVLVIGEDVDKQLAPFDESIEVEEYLHEEVSDEEKECMLKHYKVNENFEGTFDECYSKYGNRWNDNSWRKNDEGVWCDYSTYNPLSKWDWYSVGGRWSGFFKMKQGTKIVTGESGAFGNKPEEGCGDVALKKDIDFEGMMNDAADEAAKRYDKVILIIGHLPESETWKSILKRIENIDEARDFYHSQPRNVELRNKGEHWVDVEDYQCSREKYIDNARKTALSTYAVVKDGKWYEKGKMGWWGMSSDEVTQEEWNDKFMELINSVPEDTQFTIVDCHI